MIRPLIYGAGTALLVLVAGCGDSSSPAADDPADQEEQASAKPEIDDPAVAAAALREVDPCALLDAGTLGRLGTVASDSHSSAEWGECSVDVQDAEGGTVELVLRVGDQLILADDPAKELSGLPLVVDGDDGPQQCWVSVLTSYETSLGISFQVDYADGDACAAGRTALAGVVRELRDTPPRYREVPDTSVLAADPCAAPDRKAVETALGRETFVEPKDLHACDFWSGDGTSYPQVSVRFYKGLPPDAEDGAPVDLGGGLTAVQTEEEDIVLSCDVSWRRVETPTEDEADGYGELVSVMYSDDTESGLDTSVACEKAAEVARTVAPSLDRA